MNDISKISDNLKNSLESTAKGLQMFSLSLEKSGMKQSIPEYKKLQSILLQQRLWSQNHKQEALQPLWNEVSNQAAQIFDVLSSFSEIMREIQNINTIDHNSIDHNSLDSDNQDRESYKRKKTNYSEEQRLTITALSKPRYLSLEQLTIMTNLDKKQLIEIIEDLSEKGIVDKKRQGKNIQIKLHDEIIQIIDSE